MELTTLSVNVSRCQDVQAFLGSVEYSLGVCLETKSFDRTNDAMHTVVPHNLKIDERDLQDVLLQVFCVEQVEHQSASREGNSFSQDRLDSSAQPMPISGVR